MPKLPNADRALVSLEKLRDYALNPKHDKGAHKARVFASSLGFAAADAERLRAMILAAVLTHDAQLSTTDEHGTRYTVDFEATGLHGSV